MKNKILQNILISFGIIAIAIILIIILKPNNTPDTIGSFTIILIDENDKEVFNDTYEFNEEDTLWEIIKENYSDGLEYNTTPAYGIQLLSIAGVETDFSSDYISIYINGKYSTYGLSNIKLEDKMIIELKEAKVR